MSQKRDKYGLKNFVRIAKYNLDPDTTSIEGIEQAMITWFCFTYNCPPNDPRLLDMTVEELLVLFNMHRIKDDPGYEKEQLGETEGFEEWLRKEMGEEYISEEQMINEMEEHDKEYTQKVREQFPDQIKTDFTKIGK